MNAIDGVHNFLGKEGWQIIQYINLGDTADVFVVEKDDDRRVLKTQRTGGSTVRSLKMEYQVLQYLNTTPMKAFVPSVGEWRREVGGFFMEYLRYPTATEKKTYDWVHSFAAALRLLHGIQMPPAGEIDDDRPAVGKTISGRFRKLFRTVFEDSFWMELPDSEKSNLARVRSRYETYTGLLPGLEKALAKTNVALTHGDLSGDNIMLTREGKMVLIDWGAARITSALADVANLVTYASWTEEETDRFLKFYFNDDRSAMENAMPTIQILSRLYQYRSCVYSLQWLRELGEEGLDPIGRAHFERMLSAL